MAHSDSTLRDTLAQVPYLSVLAPGEMNEIIRDAVHHTYSPDEIIFLEGDPARGLWIIEDGSVKITKLSPEGNEYILHLLGPGNSFNDVAALDGGPTPANAIAMSLTSVWSIPASTLWQAVEHYPKMARAGLSMLGERVRSLTRQLEDLTLYPVMVRLARFLLAQAEDPALSEPGITRAAIAAHLATTPETISRALSKIQETGAIRFDRHRIIITDENRLRSIAVL